MYGMRIAGIAAYAPPIVVSNDDIAELLVEELQKEQARRLGEGLPPLTPDEEKLYTTNSRWIRMNIGFNSRRFSPDGEGTIDLAVKAAKLLLKELNFPPNQINGIVFGRVTPTYLYSPPDANMLQDMLGIPSYDNHGRPREIFGIDTSLACSTWVASLATTYALISSGLYRVILLIGADAMKVTIPWNDRAFATVLGNAGTACLCVGTHSNEDWFGPDRFFTFMDGSHWDAIIAEKGGSRNPIKSAADLAEYRERLRMDGPRVKELIVPAVGGPIMEEALAKADWEFGDLDLAVFHEANLAQLNKKIIERWRERGFRGEVLDSGGQFSNTTSASIPLALALNGPKLVQNPELDAPKRIALVGKGGSITCSIALGEIRHDLPTFVDV